jgi:hypothetical protein
MAVRFDSATTDALRISSGLFDYNAAYTIMAWVYPVSNPAADMQPFSIAVDGSNLDQLRTGSGATSWSARSIVGGTAVATGTASVDYATWQHLVLQRTDSSNVYLWKDGSQSTASNQAAGGRSAATQLDAGNGRAGTTPLNGRMYALKAWTVALTAAEILTEMRSVRPIRLANYWGWWPARPGATERLKDYSGNGRNWTEVGTLTDEDPAPIWWGARPSKAGFTRAPLAFTLSRSSTSTTTDVAALPVARGLTAAQASLSSTNDAVVALVARALVAAQASTSSTPDAVSLLRALVAALSAASTSSTPDTATLISLVAMAMARSLTSTTPDTVTMLRAMAFVASAAGTSTTPDVVTLLRAMVFALATSSASSTNDLTVLIRTFAMALARSSTSTTTDIAVLLNLVPLVLARSSSSTTPDVSALPIARALALALLSRSVTPDILQPRDRYIFDVPAENLASAATRILTFTVLADRLSSTASRTMTFTVPAQTQTSEA